MLLWNPLIHRTTLQQINDVFDGVMKKLKIFEKIF